MAKCIYCGAETRLYINGVPVGVGCSKENKKEKPKAAPQPKMVPPPKIRTVAPYP